jgi:hypothetical protein
MIENIVASCSKPRLLSLLQSKRFGGGGGRPAGHGRPTFNFKEKRILGLDKKYNKLKLQPTGFFSDIEEHFDPKRDFMIKFADQENFKEPDIDWTVNEKRVFNVASLYGSNKGCDMLPAKPKRQPFSYKRIFGQKGSSTSSRS